MTVVRSLEGSASPTTEVVVTRENLARAASRTSSEMDGATPTPTPPPSPAVKPVPPPRYEPAQVHLAEHVTVREVPKEDKREAESTAEGVGFSEKRRLSSTAVADDNAQKSSSQKSYETVETEKDDEGNVVTKKTITTVKTTRSTRTIIGGNCPGVVLMGKKLNINRRNFSVLKSVFSSIKNWLLRAISIFIDATWII